MRKRKINAGPPNEKKVQFRFLLFVPSLSLPPRRTFRRPADATIDVKSGTLDCKLLVAVAPVFVIGRALKMGGEREFRRGGGGGL